MDAPKSRSLPDLISALTGELANLVRKESELVRTEVAEKLTQSVRAGRQLGIGAALLLGAVLVLLQAAVLALATIIGPLWASLAVGVAIGAIGLIMVRGAADQMRPGELMPDRTARQLRQDAQLVKEQVK